MTPSLVDNILTPQAAIRSGSNNLLSSWAEQHDASVTGAITVPSIGHHKSLAHFLLNCYQTSYIGYCALYQHVRKLFLMKKLCAA